MGRERKVVYKHKMLCIKGEVLYLFCSPVNQCVCVCVCVCV